MKAFMDEDFILSTETAKKLYHEYAEVMPVLDYHCHLNPQEIYENKKYDNITQVWLGGDHYKWRQMRSNGVEEKYITGDATDREKFQKWAETLEMAIGNPLYHWSHLELKRYFGYDGYLNGETAWTGSMGISPYGKHPAANTALKDVFPAHPVSGGPGQFRKMRKSRLIRVRRIQIE